MAAVEAAKEAIVVGRGHPGRARLGRAVRRRRATSQGIDLYRALRRVSPSPYLFFVRMPDFEVVGASPELLLRVEGNGS